MKRVYRLTDLDCAHCAAKMEDGIAKIAGVKSVSINFMAQKLKIEADEEQFETIMKEVQTVISRIEPECQIAR